MSLCLKEEREGRIMGLRRAAGKAGAGSGLLALASEPQV